MPARVFARPLDLFAGAACDRARLLGELEALGYRRVGRVRDNGQYAASASRIEFHSRGFRFWDQPEPARRVQVTFTRDGRIERLFAADSGAEIALMRLEPRQIGSINPQRFEDRRLLRYDQLPQRFVRILVEVEDRRFFEHHGIDFIGLARAMVSNLRAGRLVQGGSTLTQQLVKNFYLTRERTFRRKLVEMMMALSLEWRYDKSLILETYVNEVFLGQDGNRAIHGFGLAAQFYFGKPLAELDVAEMALLVGMVKGPSAYSPRRHPTAAKQRRDVVLRLLATRSVINDSERDAYTARGLRLAGGVRRDNEQHHAFLDLVRRQLQRDYSADDLRSAGLKIYTTLDPGLQEHVAASLPRALNEVETRTRATGLQGAAIIVEPAGGEVLALIGDRDPSVAGFNRALDARRPVGSVIKPFVYAHAWSQPGRFSLATLIDDAAVTWSGPGGQTWQPHNFDGLEHGSLSLVEALTRSLNLATVNLALALGIDQVRDFLVAAGLPDSVPAYPSIALGAVDLSVHDLAGLYTAIANDGFRVPLRAIVDVTDKDDVKLNRYGLRVQAVMTAATAALVRHALRRVVARGTGRRLRSALPAAQPLAGKTGTSDDGRDSWFAGFGANRLGVVWVGRDDNAATSLTGSNAALPVWIALLKQAGLAPLEERLPDTVSLQPIDLRRAVIVPESCNNAEMTPLHERSELPRATTCHGAATAAPEVADDGTEGAPHGVFERLRNWLR